MANRYAVINSGLVENVILANSVPSVAGRTVIQLAPGQAVSPGDSYDGQQFIAYQPTAAEIERRDAPAALRQAIAALTAWQDDAQDAASLSAMTAAQRVQRQAVIEDRVARLSRIVRRMLVMQGLD